MFKGYPRLALGFVWQAIGIACLIAYLSDHGVMSGPLRRWAFAGIVGVVGGPVLILWGGAEMLLRRRPKGGGVFERDGIGTNHMADLTDALCAVARADGPKPSPATVAATTNAINSYFSCDFSEAALADRIAHYKPSPKEDALAERIRAGFSGMDERFRADFVRAAFDVAKADGAISSVRAKVFALLFVSLSPPPSAVTPEMRALMQGPVPH